MIKIKYISFLFLLLGNFLKCQIGDNGYPLLYETLFKENNYVTNEQYKNSIGNYVPLRYLEDNIPSFETTGINNEGIINEISQLKDPIYINQNIYGKSFYKEINIVDDSHRVEYNGRYYYLYKIKSSNAKALQIYFKKYYLTKGSKLFFYNENGFVLGEFNDKNNPESGRKGLEFGIQPIPGNTFYIELSYPKFDADRPKLIVEKIIHSITDFNKGAHGEAGNCHKNVACAFTGNDDKSRNIKSVGLMLYPLYPNNNSQNNFSATCSGNLINNTQQDGTPYFLTAGHCIGYEASNNNINWNVELITLFNYEAKTCVSNGSDAPSSLSNNSVLGCTLLTQSPISSNDYALLKLTGNAATLAQYKVCYAGWDNNPNSYIVDQTNIYGVHHPKGDTKKISFANEAYPVMSNEAILQSGLFGYMGVPWPQNSQGIFLQNSWRNGIVEKGSSGSPLFNSFDRLIGSLSTGPDPNIFNCDNPNIYNSANPKFYTYYSRFSNNYYTMSPWINPNGTSVQSIGPYCPNTSIQIGAPISVIINPGAPINPGSQEELPIDINGSYTHPANTWGKKLYTRARSSVLPEIASTPNANFFYLNGISVMSNNLFTNNVNIYDTANQQIINKFELWGIYKVVDCNKLKYIKPSPIIIRNPGSVGVLTFCRVDIVGMTDDKVHILIQKFMRNGPADYINAELQTYKIINNELTYVTYKPIVTNLQWDNRQYFSYHEFNKNRILIGKGQGSQNKYIFDSYLFDDSTNTWMSSNSVLTINSFHDNAFDIKMLDDKVFVLNDSYLGALQFANNLAIYNFTANSSALTLQNNLPNIFLGNINSTGILDISKKGNNEYWLVYDKFTSGGTNFQLMALNLSNNSVSHFSVSDDFKYTGIGPSTFIIRDNEIVRMNKNVFSSTPVGEYPTYQYVSFKKDSNNTWVKDKTNFLKWNNIQGFNDRYLLTVDIEKPGAIGNFSTKDRTYSLRELDYLAHPYTMYDNVTYYSAAYHRPKKLTHSLFDLGFSNGKVVFKNLIFSFTNNFPFGYGYGTYSVYPYNARTYDVKTVILDNKTESITGNKNVYVYAKYSVDIKPGFSVSSSNGVEFHAIAQEPLPIDIPTCSLTFDDMLNPQITETPNETIYLKQTVDEFKNKPYYGEIILNNGVTNQEIVIDTAIKIYPNPTKDIINVDFNGKNFKTVEVYSIEAKKLITLDVSSKTKIEINLSQYPEGIYMVNLIDSNGKTYPNKIIKK